MPYAEMKKSETLAHTYVFRVISIHGSTVRTLWEGRSLGDGEAEAERFATIARQTGSPETIALDGFRVDIERQWTHRIFTSRPPSTVPAIRHVDGTRGRPKVLFLNMEFPTWNNGAHSWSYAAGLAYEAGLKAAGCDVMTVNTPCLPFHITLLKPLLKGRRFDQVWFQCHSRHMDDFAFRSWVSEVAPVRLVLCGETIHYPEAEEAAYPWFTAQTKAWERWEPHVTHAAFVDPADVKLAGRRVRATWWKQGVPEKFVLPVNDKPRLDAAVFCGTLYPPRDRWVWDLGTLVEKVESPESEAFCRVFQWSHEWIQRVLDRAPWWHVIARQAYNRFQVGLRRYAFHNFLQVIRQGVAIVNLPSMVRTDSGRVVEGMAAGRPVLSPALPEEHESVFADGLQILRYRTVEEAAEILRDLKADPSRAKRIARNARAELLAHHTVEKRTAELLQFVETGEMPC